MKLVVSAIIKFLIGLFFACLLVFLPAGTLCFVNGWMFILTLFVPIFVLGLILLIKSPELLKKRLDGKEKEKTQKGVVAFSVFIFIVGFIVAGLDFRFKWLQIPAIISYIAIALFLISYILYAEVMRENAYLSRKIEVQEGQKVVDTGLYGIVRHPMYATTILMFLMIPIILGSWCSFVVFLFYPIIIAIRVKNEEKILSEQLEGYCEYKEKVRYKIIPFVW